MKVARTIKLLIGATLGPVITSAKINFLMRSKVAARSHTSLSRKHDKTHFDDRSNYDTPAPFIRF